MKFLNIILLMVFCSTCYANTDEVETPPYRTLTLLPDLMFPLPVEFAIPEDFVAIPLSEEAGLFQFVYWGKETEIKKFINNKPISEPIISVKPTVDVLQYGPDIFSIEMEKDPRFERIHHKDEKFSWGPFPVYSRKAILNNKLINMAYVGLNHPDSGVVLMFSLILPEGEEASLNKTYPLWENFLHETKLLPEPDIYKIDGQDLQDGITYVNMLYEKLKLTAEENKHGKIQITSCPLSKGVNLEVCKIKQGLMGGEWKRKAPLIKLCCRLNAKNEKVSEVVEWPVLSVLVKRVDEFTVPTETIKANLEYFVYEVDSPFSKQDWAESR